MSESVSIRGYKPETIEAGTYPATVVALKQGHGDYGPFAVWVFQPEGFSEDAQPAGFTSLSGARSGKGMEWARRILGKSNANDMLYGKDIRDKRPVVDWGEEELSGKPCRIVVEKNWDPDEEDYRNKVTNVLPAKSGEAIPDAKASAETENDEDFVEIPF